MKMRVCWRSAVPLLAALCAVAALGAAAGIPGGITPADLSDPGVQDALKFAVSEYNNARKDNFASKVINVVDAKIQVVAGKKYYLTVEMGRTSCRKESVEELELCPLHKVGRVRKCTFEVWSRPWLSDTRLIKKTCQ
ncbi:cystatin [Amia ocellicauda]|uniref:cystatin n=1 Tax=Amia ocellicauda TaxID=2972642 RepID=UPI0034649D7C|nr:CYT protein [Amia calva]